MCLTHPHLQLCVQSTPILYSYKYYIMTKNFWRFKNPIPILLYILSPLGVIFTLDILLVQINSY